MASKLFDYDNPFFMFMSRIWDLMILNFLAALFCLPVITAGASVTALYYVTLKMAEERESHIYRSFLKSFRNNFLQSTAIHVILSVIGAIFLLDFWYFALGGRELPSELSASGSSSAGVFASAGPVRFILAALFLALFLMYLFTLLYVYAVQARFVNPVCRTISNAFMMAIRHLPYTILIVILNVAFCCITVNYASWLFFWFLSGPVYMNSLLFCRIFKPYMGEQYNERNLEL